MESVWNNIKGTRQPVQEKKNKRADRLSGEFLDLTCKINIS
jgi:hypothetical protein